MSLKDQERAIDGFSEETQNWTHKPEPRDQIIPRNGSIFLEDPAPGSSTPETEIISFVIPRRGVTPEEQEAFRDLFNKLMHSQRPGDIIEQMQIARITSLLWDCSCVDRYLNLILRNAHSDSLKKLLNGRVENADDIAHGVRRGDPEAIDLAKETLAKFDLSEEDIHAQSFLTHFDTIERLKRLQIAATRELTRMFHDLDRRKKVRELARLRELHESFEMQHFQKFGFDSRMKVPR
jgi:hypothetical protein